MIRATLATLAVVTLSATLPAFAQQSDAPSTTGVNTRVVAYGDLNLDSSAGADTMLRRFNSASRFVCGDRTGPRTMRENGAVHDCVGDSMQNAVADLGHPNVANRYYGNVPEVVIGEDEGVDASPGKGS